MTTMTMTNLASIAERAATIAERLRGDCYELQPPNALAEARFARWISAAAKDNPERFDKRLRWSGMDRASALAACGDVRLRAGHQLPPWAETLRWVFEAPLRTQGTFRFFVESGSWPFQPVLAGIVDRASSRVDWHGACGAVQIAFERQLMTQLAETATPILQHEFEVYRAVRRAIHRTNAGSLFAAFAENLAREGGWVRLFDKYPVLARLTGTRIAFWSANIEEFLTRVEADRSSLESRFAPVTGLGDLVAAAPGLSDPHDGGKNAIFAEFSSGFQVIYKPRNIDAEPAFGRLVDWLKARGLEPALKSHETLAFADHGWSVAVEHRACETEEEVKRYYERIGVLTALLYALGTTDCHQENIIANGEFPVLIDAETVLTPGVTAMPSGDTTSAAGMAQRVVFHSVLRSLLVPPGAHLPGRQFSHLAGVMRGDTAAKVQASLWANANSDYMRLQTRDMELPATHNQVSLQGQTSGAERYVDEIVKGFEQGYRFLLAHRDELLEGPLAEWTSLPLRAVLRATRAYATLMSSALSPTAATDGVEVSLIWESLGRPFLQMEDPPPVFRVLETETDSLAQGDIPLFQTTGGSKDLEFRAGRADHFFAQSGVEVMRECLGALSEEDLCLQRALIRGGFAAVPYKPRMRAALSRDELVAEAVALGCRVRDHAIVGKGGDPFWLTVHPVGDDGWILGSMSHNLYAGTSGVALFLAALHRVTGDEEWRRWCLAAARTTSALAKDGVLGGASGTPSTAYALLQCSRLLGETRLAQEANRIAKLITPAQIDQDTVLDAIGGSAGSILCLLGVYSSTKDEELLQLAVRCGLRLLETMQASRDVKGESYWQTYEGRPLCGISHGAAGIALALHRLARATGRDILDSAAQSALRWENSQFDSSQGSWPDLRKERYFAGTWCHGAPGIGLARLEFAGMPGFQAASDVQAARAFCSRVPSSGADHVCCGDLAKAELSLEAGDPERAAWEASQIVKAARERGHYRLNWNEQYFWSSFHHGMSGIGYQLLRIAEPALGLPSVLRWQS
jgi:type 2 lantibiotic biosynthesis protein LanM